MHIFTFGNGLLNHMTYNGPGLMFYHKNMKFVTTVSSFFNEMFKLELLETFSFIDYN